MADDNKAMIASSEFDPAQFLSGFKAMTAGVEAFIKKEQELTAVLDQQEKQLQDTQKAIAATKAQIDGLDKSSNTYKNDLAALNKQQADQRALQKDLQSNIKATKTELEGTSKTVKEYTAALKNLGVTAKQVTDQNKGKNLFDVKSLAAQINQIQQAGGKLRGIFAGGLDDQALKDLEERLGGAKDEFQQLAIVIDAVKQKMQTLDPKSEEFAELAQVVQTGEEVLKEFGKTQEETAKKSQSSRTRLKELREELIRLEDAGQDNTEQFKEMQIEAGRLADSISDAQDRIRVLASDTKALDFGLAAIRGVAAGFSVAAGAAELFGIRNEDVMETIARLNAIMAVLNGLQEISNLIKKQSILLVVGEEIATKALAVSQRILAAAIGQTAAASKGLQIALLASGVGALVVVIGLLVAAFRNWTDASEDAKEQQEALNRGTQEAIDLNERLKNALEDGTKRRLTALELLQEKGKNLTATERQQLQERIRNAQQLRNAAIETTKQQITANESLENAQRDNFNKAVERQKFLKSLGEGFQVEDELKEVQKTIDNFNELQQNSFELRNELELQNLQNQRDAVRESNELRLLDIRLLEDYQKRLLEIRNRLQDAQDQGRVQNADQITKQATQRLNRELAAISRDVKKGVLTTPQGEVLKGLLRQISAVETEQELKEFNKKVVETARQLNEQLTNLRLQAATQRAELIRDELTREAATIEANAAEERINLIRERDATLREIRENVLGLDPAIVESNAQRVLDVYNTLLVQLSTKTRRAQEDLAARAFELSQEAARRTFATLGLVLTEETTKEIIDLTQRFQRGAVSYANYQKELTRIAAEETQKRIQQQITEANSLLFGVQQRQRSEKDPQRLKDLQDEETRLRQQVAELQRQLAASVGEGTQRDQQALAERVQIIAQYAQAIQGITNSVVGFWQSANDAEKAALEKSIALQQRRVDAATKLAERGNAEYLRLEEDRLRELEIKQENAARRQLAINAVLQTSQALTAFVGALAQGITTGGPVGGIAIAGAVLALLASGYAIVQNLQKSNTQRLYKGTRRVKAQHGEPDGIDTIPAMLTKDEAVVPAEKNKAYSPTMDAIFDGTIPPEVLNNFVRHYHAPMDMPAMDYTRMELALRHADKGMLTTMQEQNDLLRKQSDQLDTVAQNISAIGLQVNLDKDGFAAALAFKLKRDALLKKA